MQVVLLLGQLSFRWHFYGEWLPNTARAKLSLSSRHLEEGIDYLIGGMSAMTPISWLAAGAIIVGAIRAVIGRRTDCWGWWRSLGRHIS